MDEESRSAEAIVDPARLEDLVAHHEERLETTLDACAAPRAAIEIMRRLFRRDLDAHQTGFALAETLSHLNYLVQQGIVQRWPDPSGVLLYHAA